MRSRPAARSLLVAAALALAACEQLQPTVKPQAPAPQITEDVLRARATEQLAQGAQQYNAGDYEHAEKNLSSALDHGVLSKADQSRARKLLAFIYCVSNRETQCRDEFRKAFEINPNFSLTAAEDGHPIWGPVYRDVRTQLIAEREAGTQVRTPAESQGKGEQILAQGLLKYDSGEFVEAHRLLESALKEGLKAKPDQVRAMKYLAFTLCLQGKYPLCRQEFIKIYDVDPEFDLSPAEAGHPSWTHTFAGAKATAKRALAAKSAKEARERARAEKAKKN
jgi:Tfp pilus assembly protein PilF